MTTPQQIEANRQNALLGGVKTEEGKAISRLNALKHGLLSREVLLEGEDGETLAELGKRIRQEIKPIGEIELILSERIIANVWRLKRALESERATMEWEKFNNDTDLDWNQRNDDEAQLQCQKQRRKMGNMVTNKRVEKIIRYETTIEKGIYKALHELQRIQSARAGNKPSVPLAVDVDVSS